MLSQVSRPETHLACICPSNTHWEGDLCNVSMSNKFMEGALTITGICLKYLEIEAIPGIPVLQALWFFGKDAELFDFEYQIGNFDARANHFEQQSFKPPTFRQCTRFIQRV